MVENCTSPLHGIGRAVGRLIGRGIVWVWDLLFPLPEAPGRGGR